MVKFEYNHETEDIFLMLLFFHNSSNEICVLGADIELREVARTKVKL